jgi:hypothetical protein
MTPRLTAVRRGTECLAQVTEMSIPLCFCFAVLSHNLVVECRRPKYAAMDGHALLLNQRFETSPWNVNINMILTLNHKLGLDDGQGIV